MTRVEFKRDAALTFGATHACADMTEAIGLVQRLTNGDMADRVIMVPSVMYGDLMQDAMTLTGKARHLVATRASADVCSPRRRSTAMQLAMFGKEVKGTIFGSGNPRTDIPRLLGLYKAGKLKLDELVTRTYRLEDINEGYDDMREGRNIRGVIVFD